VPGQHAESGSREVRVWAHAGWKGGADLGPEAGVGLGGAVGPGLRHGLGVALDACGDLGACKGVGDELDDGGGGSDGQSADVKAEAVTGVERVGDGDRVRLCRRLCPRRGGGAGGCASKGVAGGDAGCLRVGEGAGDGPARDVSAVLGALDDVTAVAVGCAELAVDLGNGSQVRVLDLAEGPGGGA